MQISGFRISLRIGIEQHRAKANAPYAYTDGSKGYLRQADVIRLMELNGFELVRSARFIVDDVQNT